MTTIQTLPDHLTQLLSSKGQLGLTFAEIAEKIGKPEVWTAAVFYGQAVPEEATAQKLLDILRIGSAVEMNALLGKTTGVRGMVERGAGWECPPKDPVLYRLYEVLVVYGHSYKALIAEKFGDGIMSAIDFRTSLVRKPDPKGDRVVITLDGKFLPYSPPEAWKE